MLLPFSFVVAAYVAPPNVNNRPLAAHPAQVAFEGARSQMLDDLNATRAQAGLPRLRFNTTLNEVASEHAADMALHDYFDHRSPDGRSPFDRMTRAGYHFSYAGENIALSDSEAEAYQALLNSPEHRANILNGRYGHVGIGVARSPDGSLLFVQDFSD